MASTLSLRYAPRAAAPEPMVAINITPLIDVLLVLLIMLILTIPAMTHKVPVDLPQPGPVSQVPLKVHDIALDPAGVVRLDGHVLAPGGVTAALTAAAQDPDTTFRFAADAHAPYGKADALLAAIKRAGITRLGFVGNERFAQSLD